MDGEIQTINVILLFPLKVSLKTLKELLKNAPKFYLVNFEFLKGIWVLLGSVRAETHKPKVDKLPFIEVSSDILSSFSSAVRSFEIANFSEPARSIIFNFWMI